VTITLVFLALLMAAILWWLFRQTVDVQPWLAEGVATDVRVGVLDRPTAKTALIVFLGVATSLFALFISAYAMRINFLDWSPLPQPRLLMFNTALLVVASATMEWTVFAARRGNLQSVRAGLLASGVLSFGFLAGQLWVWKQLADAGYYVATSAAAGFFYVLTAVHGLHVLGGLVAWGRVSARARRGTDFARIRLGAELCAIYWHFLLIVWVVLFAVLVSQYLGLAICAPSTSL
jgi:cytochrome c oxidase subunit 3